MVSTTAPRARRSTLPLLLAALLPTTSARADPGVVAIARDGQPGFWVPRAEFLALERAREQLPLALLELEQRKREALELRSAVRLWTATATSAEARAREHWTFYTDERTARLAAEERLLELRLRPSWEGPVWALGAAAVTAAIAIGIDRARVHETP